LLDGSNSNSYQVGANAGEVITVSTTNFRTDNYGNYRMGALAATATSNLGDLTLGSAATMVSSSATSAATGRLATGGSMTINGALGSGNITYASADSAKSVAKLINDKASNTGVTATAKTEFDLTGMSASGTYSFTIQSNNTTAVSINFTVEVC